MRITKNAYEIEWLSSKYLVTPFHDSGVVHIQEWVDRRFRKGYWRTIFFNHIELLSEISKLTIQSQSTKQFNKGNSDE